MKRILHLSDPHFGAVDTTIAAKFLRDAHAMEPDLTVLSGDLTMRARRQELLDSRVFAEALPKPMLMIPGNHDIPASEALHERFLNPFKRYRETFGPDLEPELVIDGIHVVGLNSSRAFGLPDWSVGRVSSSQLARVRNSFANGPAGHLRILVLHHPLLELQLSGRSVVKGLKPLLETIEAARIDLVMCGHFHTSQILLAGITNQWRAVISQAPTVCSTRLQGEPQGFHEFSADPQRIEAIHHQFNNGSFVSARRSAFSRHENGWHESSDQHFHGTAP